MMEVIQTQGQGQLRTNASNFQCTMKDTESNSNRVSLRGDPVVMTEGTLSPLGSCIEPCLTVSLAGMWSHKTPVCFTTQ